MKNEFNISVDNGLCNKLRALFSGLHYANKNNLNFNVYWSVHPTECPCHFLDVFKPVDGVNFTEHVDDSFLKKANKWIGEKGYQLNHKYNPHEIDYFPNLIPVDSIQKEINEIINKENDFVAVHLRNGRRYVNMAKTFKCYNPPEDFIKRIPVDKKIFLATDSKEIQDLFVDKYGSRLFFNKKIESKSTRTPNSVESIRDSVIDLFVCINSSEFIGSNMSSFSEVIINKRKFNGK